MNQLSSRITDGRSGTQKHVSADQPFALHQTQSRAPGENPTRENTESQTGLLFAELDPATQAELLALEKQQRSKHQQQQQQHGHQESAPAIPISPSAPGSPPASVPAGSNSTNHRLAGTTSASDSAPLAGPVTRSVSPTTVTLAAQEEARWKKAARRVGREQLQAILLALGIEPTGQDGSGLLDHQATTSRVDQRALVARYGGILFVVCFSFCLLCVMRTGFVKSW